MSKGALTYKHPPTYFSCCNMSLSTFRIIRFRPCPNAASCENDSAVNDFGNTILYMSVLNVYEQVDVSGAVNGKAVWPKSLAPVAWHRDSEMVRMKLGLYHSTGNVSSGSCPSCSCSLCVTTLRHMFHTWATGNITLGRSLPLLSLFQKVHDQEVEYKNISIEGPNGIIRTSNKIHFGGVEPGGYLYKGCVKDVGSDRVFDSKSKSSAMTTDVSNKC